MLRDTDRMDLVEARRRLAEMRPQLDEIVAFRADLMELRADLAEHGTSPLGGLAEAKAHEARLHATLEAITASGAELKGWAPLLLDFPGRRDGVDVLWCWLEGDGDIAWYHRLDCGFAGRRPI
ncbi:MAG TPA: DUF2203 domain-containing protein [Micromonosporaceae bacterium]|jgi:hypothetical protein